MLGDNPTAKPRSDQEGFLVHSIFRTIQGEGPYSGSPSLFVRFSGCNLHCSWCDTLFETGDPFKTAGDLAAKIIEAIPHTFYRIVFTGGEPLLQPLPSLIKILAESGFNHKMDIETAGLAWPDGMDEVVQHVNIVCSPKVGRVLSPVQQNAKAWKYIIQEDGVDPVDGLPNLNTQKHAKEFRVVNGGSTIFRPPRNTPHYNVFVQPCDELNEDKNERNLKTCIQSAMKFGYRLCIQTHKIAGLP